MIAKHNAEVVSLDTEVSETALHKDKIQLYDGNSIPYSDKWFDTVICNFVLHHSNDPEQLFSELVRVSKSIIVISEETHENFLQKVRSIFNCWNVNRKAGQSVQVNWSSYLHTHRLNQMIRNLQEIQHIKEDRGVYIYEFLILQKNSDLPRPTVTSA